VNSGLLAIASLITVPPRQGQSQTICLTPCRPTHQSRQPNMVGWKVVCVSKPPNGDIDLGRLPAPSERHSGKPCWLHESPIPRPTACSRKRDRGGPKLPTITRSRSISTGEYESPCRFWRKSGGCGRRCQPPPSCTKILHSHGAVAPAMGPIWCEIAPQSRMFRAHPNGVKALFSGPLTVAIVAPISWSLLVDDGRRTADATTRVAIPEPN